MEVCRITYYDHRFKFGVLYLLLQRELSYRDHSRSDRQRSVDLLLCKFRPRNYMYVRKQNGWLDYDPSSTHNTFLMETWIPFTTHPHLSKKRRNCVQLMIPRFSQQQQNSLKYVTNSVKSRRHVFI